MKRLFRNAMLILMGIMAALLLVELGLRLFFQRTEARIGGKGLFMADPVLGWRLRPGAEGRFRGENGQWIHLRVNALGLRDRELSRARPAQTYRILCLGDSFTFSGQLELERTYPKVLEQLLNQNRQGRRFEVINAGIDGYGTEQEYLFFRDHLLGLRPDMLIVGFFGFNDVGDVKGSNHRRFSVDERGLLRRKVRRRYSLKHLAIYRYLQKALYATQEEKKSRLPEPYRQKASPEFGAALARTQALLSRISRLAAERGVAVLFVYIPMGMEVSRQEWGKNGYGGLYSEERFNHDVLRMAEVFTRYARGEGIPTLNLIPEFRRHASEKLYLEKDPHWNEKGTRLAAEQIYRYLLLNRFIAGLDPGSSPIATVQP